MSRRVTHRVLLSEATDEYGNYWITVAMPLLDCLRWIRDGRGGHFLVTEFEEMDDGW